MLSLVLVAPASGTIDPSQTLPVDAGGRGVFLGPDGTSVVLSGEIGEGLTSRLEALLAAHPGIRRLVLTSEGGFVDEAKAIGTLVAGRGLETYAQRYCVSACTLVFVQGATRLAEPDARLGFHAPYVTDETGREIQVDADEERRVYVAAGVDPAFVREALDVASSEIWFPDADRLIAAGVVTRFVSEVGAGPVAAR